MSKKAKVDKNSEYQSETSLLHVRCQMPNVEPCTELHPSNTNFDNQYAIFTLNSQYLSISVRAESAISPIFHKFSQFIHCKFSLGLPDRVLPFGYFSQLLTQVRDPIPEVDVVVDVPSVPSSRFNLPPGKTNIRFGSLSVDGVPCRAILPLVTKPATTTTLFLLTICQNVVETNRNCCCVCTRQTIEVHHNVGVQAQCAKETNTELRRRSWTIENGVVVVARLVVGDPRNLRRVETINLLHVY